MKTTIEIETMEETIRNSLRWHPTLLREQLMVYVGNHNSSMLCFNDHRQHEAYRSAMRAKASAVLAMNAVSDRDHNRAIEALRTDFGAWVQAFSAAADCQRIPCGTRQIIAGNAIGRGKASRPYPFPD